MFVFSVSVLVALIGLAGKGAFEFSDRNGRPVKASGLLAVLLAFAIYLRESLAARRAEDFRLSGTSRRTAKEVRDHARPRRAKSAEHDE